MRKIHWIIILAAALMMVTGVVNAQTIAGTQHDLSADTTYGADADDSIDNGEVCVYCHTPHSANANAPLWNKNYTPPVFTLYDSLTLDTSPVQPGAQSLACLSCHDGTIAVDNLANAPGLNAEHVGVNQFAPADLAYVGSDLSDDHPIGIDYTVVSGDADFVASPATSVLYANLVECATCHQVHDDSNGSFLRESNTGSQVCYDCHIK